MLLRLPPSLHYPIVLTKVQRKVGESIQRNDSLFLYSYTTKVKEGSRYDDEEKEVERKFVAHFPSTLEGVIKGWRVWEGDVIPGPKDIIEVEEECPHEVQYLGLCTNCGKDMTTVESGGASTYGMGVGRAPIRMAHDTPHLTISADEAAKIDEEAKKRLLGARKLSLVVDLDQTIIHAAVDPTIGEWQRDKDNPNHHAVKDVRSFQLLDDGPGMRGCWYYIKLRPGLEEFLESISRLYELHIYTMGTRQYAKQISDIVDPEHKYFGDRILSRDESGSMVAKNLERLFPVDTKMVVIIDDRGDVWKWSANLIRVTPFDFFVGIGDINSSFLPRKQEIQTTPAGAEAKKGKEEPAKASEEAKENGDAASTNGIEDSNSDLPNGTSTLESLIAMSGPNDPALREVQNKSQEEIISSQLEDKPLLRMQQQQDERDEKEAEVEAEVEAEAEAEAEAKGAGADTPTTAGPNGTTASEAQSSPSPATPSQPPSQSQSQSTDSDSESSDSSTSSTGSGAMKQKPAHRHSILKNDDDELLFLEQSLTTVHTAFFREWDKKRLSGKGGRVAALSGKRKAPIATADDQSTPLDLMLVPDMGALLPPLKRKVLSGVVLCFSGVLPLGTDIQNADISTWAKTFGARVEEEVTRDVTHVVAARAGTAKVKRAVKRGLWVVGTSWLIGSVRKWRREEERMHLLDGVGGKKADDIKVDDKSTAIEIGPHDFLLSDSDESTGFDTDTNADGDSEDDTGIRHEQPSRKKLKLDTTKVADDQDEDSFPDEGSPLTIGDDQWAEMDAEMREFLGDDFDSESDAESTASALSYREKRVAKRRREDDEDVSDGHGPSRASKAAKGEPSVAGGSRLKAVRNVDSERESNGNATPDAERNEQKKVEGEQRQEQADESDSDDELARELEAELERGSDEEP